MGRSRGNYPQSKLFVTINKNVLFEETLSHTWTNYKIIFHSSERKWVDSVFSNADMNDNYASQISCMELKEA